MELEIRLTGKLNEIVRAAKKALTGLGLDGPELFRARWALNRGERAVLETISADRVAALWWTLQLKHFTAVWRLTIRPANGDRLPMPFTVWRESIKAEDPPGDPVTIVTAGDGVLIDY